MGQTVANLPTQDSQQFKQQYEQFVQFVKKHDYLGLARSLQVATIGYPKVAFDLCQCLYNKLSGGECNLKQALGNFLKLIPASLLMGTAKFLAPPLLGLEVGAAIGVGIQAIQYLYWPFWTWAARNLNNADPEVAKKAAMMMAAIPQQFREMLAVNQKKKMTR